MKKPATRSSGSGFFESAGVTALRSSTPHAKKHDRQASERQYQYQALLLVRLMLFVVSLFMEYCLYEVNLYARQPKVVNGLTTDPPSTQAISPWSSS